MQQALPQSPAHGGFSVMILHLLTLRLSDGADEQWGTGKLCVETLVGWNCVLNPCLEDNCSIELPENTFLVLISPEDIRFDSALSLKWAVCFYQH